MKRFIFMLLGALYVLPAWAQHASDSLWVKKHYYKQERRIPMRDGVHLFTAIYLPKDNSEKHPILITRTPYSAAPYGEQHLTPNLWNIYWNSYAHENYIIVVQDVRGRWMSEGEFKDVRPFNPHKQGKDIDEASDTYDTIDWLLKNIPGNNGQVGAFGISYPGFYTTMADMQPVWKRMVKALTALTDTKNNLMKAIEEVELQMKTLGFLEREQQL
jgi:putative CocE/NonD family hydrolase